MTTVGVKGLKLFGWSRRSSVPHKDWCWAVRMLYRCGFGRWMSPACGRCCCGYWSPVCADARGCGSPPVPVGETASRCEWSSRPPRHCSCGPLPSPLDRSFHGRVPVQPVGILYYKHFSTVAYNGHVTRGSAGNLALTVLEGSVDGLRHQGRPKRQWIDDIEEWSGCSYIQLKEMSQVREQWRRKTIEWSSAVANRHRRWSTSEWVSEPTTASRVK